MANKQLKKEEIIEILEENIDKLRSFSVKRLGLFGIHRGFVGVFYLLVFHVDLGSFQVFFVYLK